MIWIILGIFFGVLFIEGALYLYKHNEFPFSLFYEQQVHCPIDGCKFSVEASTREETIKVMRRHIQTHSENEQGDRHAA